MPNYRDGLLVIHVAVRTLCGHCPATNHSDHSKHLANKKRWRDTHREHELVRKKAKGYTDIRRGRIRANRYVISAKEWRELRDGQCFYCGINGGQVDHIIPLAKGGTHGIGNLVSSCRSCNQSKGSKLLIEWRRDANR